MDTKTIGKAVVTLKIYHTIRNEPFTEARRTVGGEN